VHGPAGGAGEIEDLVCLLSRDERKERIEDDDWRKKRWPVVGAEARYLYRAGPTEVERTSQLSPSRWICKLDRTLRRERSSSIRPGHLVDLLLSMYYVRTPYGRVSPYCCSFYRCDRSYMDFFVVLQGRHALNLDVIILIATESR
jgi:hypothetical protein